ncbi:hypothetical protein KLP28_02985 [Nocardioidaceae bacterium]|nr:hypothetical protein KLP28_02985 [Nocardioidaceae bacterium]
MSARPVPREAADRCSVVAELREEPLAGTALSHARLLLVEQPGPWGPRGLVESRADPQVADDIDHLAAAAGLRLQGVRRPRRHADDGDRDHFVAVVDTVTGRVRSWTVPSLSALRDSQRAAADPDPALARERLVPAGHDVRDLDQPLYLVCTHGRHDACCAIRGRPLAEALHRVRPGQVWETTHIGGDRFAANVLVVPQGETYGRVRPEDSPALVSAVERGEVATRWLRGRMGLPPVVQTALVAAHEQLDLPRRDALSVREVSQRVPGTAVVLLEADHLEVEVEVVVGTSEPARLTCRGPARATARTTIPGTVVARAACGPG